MQLCERDKVPFSDVRQRLTVYSDEGGPLLPADCTPRPHPGGKHSAKIVFAQEIKEE